ncbi:unnamed protein product [Oppiella nova]|uniref:Uncharacterized protein n=1 Tax=Oppiella nova TaxID=334625 RepID=A0A7R9ML23_9ACAR|nr:unnamed protein product [Oppiella nova]CAG2179387.1 unnamed protein product [Oppiella nova]
MPELTNSFLINIGVKDQKEGKRSKKCQQYGHSCLGGHGKRSQELSPGMVQHISELQRINDPLLERMANLLRIIITQRMDTLQRQPDNELQTQMDFEVTK